ncbi:MAG TPA: ATP-dependent DNA helicase [Nocardioidaceae bacterium]|nr:ATP-dependent DNA helicase [Nocardioidaceae bacterium]
MSTTERVAPSVEDVLAAAVAAVGGEDRPGQVEMARAVRAALTDGTHLLVQAGTGTGKSLAYLVPAVLHGDRVVVATATLALQHQLVERDIPAMLEAVAGVLGERPTYAVLKGRSNYACLHRVRSGVPDDQGVLVDVPEGSLGAEVVRLREWAEEEARSGGPGDRDGAPRHTDRVWGQVSVSHRECLGAARCPFAVECFAERAREQAMRSQLIVTNHALLAIDAVEGVPMIPDYDVVVVDEAHELAARVTQAATDELSAPMVERAARRAGNFVDGSEADDLGLAAEALRDAIDGLAPGRIDEAPEQLATALGRVRDTARATFSAVPRGADDAEPDAARQQARGLVDEVRKVAERMAPGSSTEVLWLAERDRQRGGNQLCVAPIEVWGLLRGTLLTDKTVVLTSATLRLGGDFGAMAGSIGLKQSERVPMASDEPDSRVRGTGRPAADDVGEAIGETAVARAEGRLSAGDASPTAPGPGDGAGGAARVAGARSGEAAAVLPWRAVDVGSPFDYGRQAILYVARSLPTPGRDGIGSAQLDELAGLVEAAGGRTLGLFSSRRAAEAAAEAVRAALPHLPIRCQGEGQLAHLRAEFVANPAVSLFGTLSLWQGLDVPGPTCSLVVIDRIPFPRPDDPLMSARARAVSRTGGNGFMAVAATHAALLLAQGSGRLIRTRTDRGVVAVLDPRLATARYAGFLRASLPPMWPTTDGALVRAALHRLVSPSS